MKQNTQNLTNIVSNSSHLLAEAKAVYILVQMKTFPCFLYCDPPHSFFGGASSLQCAKGSLCHVCEPPVLKRTHNIHNVHEQSLHFAKGQAQVICHGSATCHSHTCRHVCRNRTCGLHNVYFFLATQAVTKKAGKKHRGRLIDLC